MRNQRAPQKAGQVRRMRAVGYIRVSTDQQAQEGVSLDAQRARLNPSCHGAAIACLPACQAPVAQKTAVCPVISLDLGGTGKFGCVGFHSEPSPNGELRRSVVDYFGYSEGDFFFQGFPGLGRKTAISQEIRKETENVRSQGPSASSLGG